jgi:hypothetical protein
MSLRCYVLRLDQDDCVLTCYVIAKDSVQARQIAIKDDPIWEEASAQVTDTEFGIGCKRFVWTDKPCRTCGK